MNLNCCAIVHVAAATPVILLSVKIMGALSGLAIIGGVVAIFWNAYSQTEMNIFGALITTGHVGVAFVALGLITMTLVLRSVLKRTKELAALPKD